jgi:hypothetical protein
MMVHALDGTAIGLATSVILLQIPPRLMLRGLNIVTYRVVRVTRIEYSSSDLLAPWLQILLVAFKYSAIVDLRNLRITVAHALRLSVFTSRLLTTDLNKDTSTSTHYEFFLLFRLQSLWNLGNENSAGPIPPTYD